MRMTLRRFSSAKRLRGFILLLLGRLLWGKRSDDLLEARIAVELIPPRQQFQSAVTEEAGQLHSLCQMFQGKVLLTNPCGDDGRILDHVRSVEGILLHRHQLDGTPDFAQ